MSVMGGGMYLPFQRLIWPNSKARLWANGLAGAQSLFWRQEARCKNGYVSFSNIAFLPIAQLYFAPEIGEAGIFANIRCCAAEDGGT